MTMDMCQLFKMMNPIQNYAWGSRTAIAELLGKAAPAEAPQAELWMGAHPKAPSRVMLAEEIISLTELIADHPEAILGSEAAHRFKGRMPFLYKGRPNMALLSSALSTDAETRTCIFV